MANIFNRIIILFSIIILLQSRLQVYNPESLKNVFKNNSIVYTVANFGHIPFGKSLIGKIGVLQPKNGCNFDQLKSSADDASFLLIQRGQCTFVKKVENAQKLGAKLAIISDNVPQFGSYVTMKDDGNGYKINIPSIMIDMNDGKKLMQQAKKQDVYLKIVFDIQKTEKVNLTLWLQTTERKSYWLIRNFAEHFDKIKDYVNLNLSYYTMNCFYCKAEDCISEDNFTRYCALSPNQRQLITGQNIINQQLRQKIVFKHYPNKWWQYMDQYDLQCTDMLQAKVCSAKIFKKLSIDEDMIQNSIASSQISLLKQDRILLENGGISIYPSASINTIKVPGNLKGQYLFQQICNTLLKPPSVCNIDDDDKQQIVPVSKSYFLIILLVIAIITIIFVISFCIYRRCLRREMSNEMNSQVNEMVGKYIEFYSERNNKS